MTAKRHKMSLFFWKGKFEMSEKNYERSTITNGRGTSKVIDMEYVYDCVDKGCSVKSIAEELGVTLKTLYRHHKKFQQKLKDSQQETGGRLIDGLMDSETISKEFFDENIKNFF